MSLQVLYITVQFPVPSETFAAVEVRALRTLGVDLSIATLKAKPEDAEQLNRERGLQDLKVDYASLGSLLQGLWLFFRHPKLSFLLLRTIFSSCGNNPVDLAKSLWLIPRSLQLFKKIERDSPDIVHLYWGHYTSLTGLLVHRYLPGVSVTQSFSAYDLHMSYGPSIVLGRALPLIFTLAEANVPLLADQGFDPKRISVVFHGIDTEAADKAPVAKHQGRVVLAERLIPEKCTADSLQALKRVYQAHPDMTVEILGDGPERERLEALTAELGLSDAVRFLGHVSHSQVYRSFSEAQVFLMMSNLAEERLPNAVKEAMQAQCLCVVSRTIGIEELIDDQKTGFVVEQGDIELAARRVSSGLENRDEWPALRAKAKSHIESNFSSSAAARQRIDAWEKLAANKP
ncbi:glycosyltransferase [Denitrobaculum tricleocarpae]|uniref:Glycosyltransferase family 4 protein n=1 Tax=Denitrobaculum tricleocarpae TaxID=2591009 RepID=A0A545U2D2_9PROT|nr:glycosyltransferase [Denitrobaculum tricleocarpae]TQV83640.1 glycosyltransferase family 4 protein [Denitrobaculum tricleocarpae]